MPGTHGCVVLGYTLRDYVEPESVFVNPLTDFTAGNTEPDSDSPGNVLVDGFI
jgi:hypothetical protein